MSEEIVQGKVEIDVTNYLNNIDKTLQKLTEYMEKNETVNKNVREEQEKTSKSTKGLTEDFKELVKGFLAGEAISKVKDFWKSAFEEAEGARKGTEAVNQALKNAGKYSEALSLALQDQASNFEQLTGAEAEDVQQIQQLTLSFEHISINSMPKITKAALDMSAGITRSLDNASSYAMQLGKALDNPAESLDGLSRIGIKFTDIQKKQIENFVESGDLQRAQNMILDEINRKFGGQAEKMKSAATDVKIEWKSMLEQYGKDAAPVFDIFFEKAQQLIKMMKWVLSPDERAAQQTQAQIEKDNKTIFENQRRIREIDKQIEDKKSRYTAESIAVQINTLLTEKTQKQRELDIIQKRVDERKAIEDKLEKDRKDALEEASGTGGDEEKANEKKLKKIEKYQQNYMSLDAKIRGFETEAAIKQADNEEKRREEDLKKQKDFINKEKEIEEEKTSCQLDENEKRLKIQKNYQEEVKESTTKMNEYILDLREKEKKSLEDEMKQSENMADKRDKQHKSYVAKEKKNNISLIASQESMKNAKENSLNDVYDLQTQILEDTLTGEWKGLSEYGKIITQQIQMEYAATAAKAGIGSLWHFALGLGDLAAAMMGNPNAGAAATTEFETAGQMAAIAATAGATSFVAGAAGRSMGGGGSTEATSETVVNATTQQKAIKESLTNEKRVYISEADYFKSVRNGLNPALQKVLENGGSVYVKS